MPYAYLKTNDLTLMSVWNWARQLVNDLNSAAAKTSTGTSAETGSITMWAGDAAPEGWLLCDGGSYTKTQYPELFLVIGYTYGGSGDLFQVPDCRDRLLIGAGSLVALGDTAGSANVAIGTENLPAHSHEVNDPGHSHSFTGDPHDHAVTDPGHTHSGGAASATPSGGSGSNNEIASQASTSSATTGIDIVPATAGGTISSVDTNITLESTGEGLPLSVLNPVIGINMIIKT